ncbi:phosphoacetylglucosamine mutase [Malassezia sp. CBS 17886]|nr:phosphoacetylglucosamine mutase [Malassezia sp. CBS 17886]
MSLPTDRIAELSARHPKPATALVYGTAGFRTKAELLDSTCFRIGLIGALRSKALGGQYVGLMVTASHNPEADNGVKMVDARGEMLDAAWEPVCTRVANAATPDALLAALRDIVDSFHIDLSVAPHAVYACDTRPSSPALVQAIADGLSAFPTHTVDGGVLTTPQLHYLVLAHNTAGTPDAYGEPTVDGYYRKLGDAFLAASDGFAPPAPLLVDCANGVGAKALEGLMRHVDRTRLPLIPLRTGGPAGSLNHGCGADFVKTRQRLPEGYDQEPSVRAGELLCSFDGDADRILFYYLDGPAADPASFHLLDGDKIATLASDYLGELVRDAGLDLRLGCVQTAYANGASTAYLAERGPITCTATGVKHLHHAAEAYDIGVYFEANGHGTVVFSPHARDTLKSARPAGATAQQALQRLARLADVINQTVGDAVSDMLMVFVILAARGWGPKQWDASYQDLPNRLLKVLVPDRTQFRTTDAERQLTHPEGLQEKIDALVCTYPRGRSFVRPSGTEDCVRVYAEAATPAAAQELGERVAQLVAQE